jgi:hypothetical protein
MITSVFVSFLVYLFSFYISILILSCIKACKCYLYDDDLLLVKSIKCIVVVAAAVLSWKNQNILLNRKIHQHSGFGRFLEGY